MRKILYFLLFVLLIFLAFEACMYIGHSNSNLVIRISNCNPDDTLSATTLIVENVDTSELYLQHFNPCFFSNSFYYGLPLGSQKIILSEGTGAVTPVLEIEFDIYLVSVIDIFYQEDGTYTYKMRYLFDSSMEI